ncbi:MAG TPA: hypothetical protein VFI97_07455 [Arthrobacter sp.]|nr:hypothetical protein [Arthrobacter sp.]
MDLRSTAAELYALLPGDFIASRNAKAKEANQSGDKDLGKQIRALPKPSMAAWLVNMLVRDRSEEIDGVLELGVALRQAQEDLDQKQLRELGRQRHELLSALVEQARSLADELDQKVSEAVADDVEQTLHAAMADGDAAAAVATGMLTRALSSTGWEPVDLDGSVAVPEVAEQVSPAGTPPQPSKAKGASSGDRRKGPAKDKKSAGRKTSKPRKQEEEDEEPEDDAGEAPGKAPEEAPKEAPELEEARSSLEEAEERAQEAEARQHSVEEQLEEADSRQEKLAAEIDKLKKRLQELEQEREDVDGEVDRLESEQDVAIHAAKDARRDIRRARRRVNELS